MHVFLLYLPMQESKSLLKGSLNAIILTLLSSKGSMYGYEICQHVKELTAGQMRITEGALYPALHKLEGDGLLISHSEMVDGRSRKYYAIAPERKEQAVDHLTKVQEFIAQLQTVLSPDILPDLKMN